MSSSIVLVYHSGYGHTERVAAAVARGAGAQTIRVDEQGNVPADAWVRLDQARAIVFGSPTYMANVSWQFKKFADATSAVWAKQGWKNKLAAAFTNSAGINGDKLVALQTIFALSQQHGMLWVGTGMMPSNTKEAVRDDVNYLASFAGLMAATPADASPGEMHPGDLKTAELFGKRIAEVVAAHRATSSQGEL